MTVFPNSLGIEEKVRKLGMRIFVQISCDACISLRSVRFISCYAILVYRCHLSVFCKLKMSEISSWENIENDRKLKNV